jgi:hypothetical protein
MGVYIAVADMEVELADRVLETTQTSGTGTYTLDGVSTAGRISFVTGVESGNRTIYVCEAGSTWEIGIGTVTAGSPDTLSRDYILATSAGAEPGGAAISWPTTAVKQIFSDTVAALLEQIISVAGANTFTAIQTVHTGNDNENPLIIKNSTNQEVVQLRVASGGAGAINVRTAAGSTVAALSGSVSSRGSLQLNSHEVYPLAEGLATPVSLTGTSVNFTVRSDARRITVLFGVGCSSNGTSPWLIRLGDSGGIESTDYASTVATATGDTTATSTVGFRLQVSVDAAQSYTGEVVLTRFHPSTHTWQCKSNLDGVQHGTGVKTTSAAITTVRITTTNGTDSFDAGTVGLLVE